MGLLAGFGGAIKIGGKALPNVGEWEFEYENEILTAEIMGRKNKNKEYGQGEGSGSMSLYFDYSDVPDTDTENTDHLVVIQAALEKQKLSAEFVPNSEDANGFGIVSATILIANFNVAVETNDFVMLEVEFEVDGDPSFAFPQAA